MNNIHKEIINEFEEKIREISNPESLFLIGSNKEKELDLTSDLDIIIIVENNINCYEYVKQITPILKNLTVKYNIMVNAYPIKSRIFKEEKSEFLNNIRQNGVKL